MRQQDIKEGRTYTGDAAGMIKRKVIAIGVEVAPGRAPAPGIKGILYEQGGKEYTRYLDTFAGWAIKEVKP